ncbi:MAG: GNAT family N-acetyltransferase [Treponema sp.]|nr:GNAT family N-acetyltransferase [Treponema sp.]
MTIRSIKETDFSSYYELSLKLDKETVFRLYEVGERQYNPVLFCSETRDFIKRPNCNIFLAVDNGMPIGYLQAIGRSARRVRHIVSINIAILQDYTGKGIGAELFKAAEDWARKKDIKRLELSVMLNNAPAIKLYSRLGYVREGLKRGSMFVDGKYIDEYYMCKWLD